MLACLYLHATLQLRSYACSTKLSDLPYGVVIERVSRFWSLAATASRPCAVGGAPWVGDVSCRTSARWRFVGVRPRPYKFGHLIVRCQRILLAISDRVRYACAAWAKESTR